MSTGALMRASLSAHAHAVVLGLMGTLVAIASPACEVVSGLDGLESVDALRGDSSVDANVKDSSSEGRFDDSAPDEGVDTAVDAADPDVLSPDAGELDASQCNAAADCGAPACTYVHANGTGQTFLDCVPQGTYDTTQATEACVAYTGNPSQCHAATCGAASVVCSSGALTSCACWGFAGAGAGHVESSGQAGILNCVCPGPTAPGWN